MKQTVSPISLSGILISLGLLKIIGRKTMTEVSVAAVTATDTSREPSSAAARLLLPPVCASVASMCRRSAAASASSDPTMNRMAGP